MSRIPIVSSNILRADGGASSWKCEPMKYCDDRQSLVFCGEVMGGGSRINGMVYTRGTAADYDAWVQLGHPDWSYEKLLPYFMKSETLLGSQKSAYRGDSGAYYLTIITHFIGGSSLQYRAMDYSNLSIPYLVIQRASIVSISLILNCLSGVCMDLQG